jgi:uncharacterized protein (DUF39 family)/Pyruvate/2-oxoacid:ferredoxin oxidoreductase delta subunit
MSDIKTFEEINERAANGLAVVLTAREFKELAKDRSPEALAREVDVVTTATFAPMCSSGAFVNFGHTDPPLRMERIFLDGVEAHGGLAAVDAFIGATQESSRVAGYGGAHVIEKLISGRKVLLEARGKGTDCYPGTGAAAWIGIEDLNQCWFFNPRNCYQNYGAAANSGERALATYLGTLEARFGSIAYATSGELSPLLNDPRAETIGPGSAAFVAGSIGHVVAPGTQFDTSADPPLDAQAAPERPSRTLALFADAKKADPRFLAAARIPGYGISLFVGVGFAVPVLDAAMARRLSIRDESLFALVRDYAKPGKPVVGRFDYASLRSGSVEFAGRRVPTSCSSSIPKAIEICEALAEMVRGGKFPIRAPFEPLPREGTCEPFRGERDKGERDKGERLDGGREARRVGPARYAEELCLSCGFCLARCPSGALSTPPPERRLRYDADACSGCGRCASACPRGALGSRGGEL